MGPFPKIFGQFKERPTLKLHEMISVPHVVACVIVLLFVLSSRLAGKSAQIYDKLSFFSIFSRLCAFPQVFGQVNEWPIVEFQEMIIMSHLVARPIVFTLFDD